MTRVDIQSGQFDNSTDVQLRFVGPNHVQIQKFIPNLGPDLSLISNIMIVS